MTRTSKRIAISRQALATLSKRRTLAAEIVPKLPKPILSRPEPDTRTYMERAHAYLLTIASHPNIARLKLKLPNQEDRI